MDEDCKDFGKLNCLFLNSNHCNNQTILRSRNLAKARKRYQKVVAITKRRLFEKDFRFGSQIKAAAGSVMDNIAEGFERQQA
jgi:hypothetical protein